MAGVNRHFPGSDALGKFHRRDDFLYRRLPYGWFMDDRFKSQLQL